MTKKGKENHLIYVQFSRSGIDIFIYFISLELFEGKRGMKKGRREEAGMIFVRIIDWSASRNCLAFFYYPREGSQRGEKEMEYKCYKSCLNVCEIDHDHRSGDCWGFSDTLMTEGWVVARWMGHCDELLMLSLRSAPIKGGPSHCGLRGRLIANTHTHRGERYEPCCV